MNRNPKMMYSNLRAAFIIQLIVSLLCLLGILAVSGKMIVIFGFMGIRPLILPRREVRDMEPYWRFYNRIGKISAILTLITLVVLVVFLRMIKNHAIADGIDLRIWALAILPYFLTVHAMVGLSYIDRFEPF